MKRIYYKVVFHKKDGRRVSAWLGDINSKYSLEYPPMALVEAHPMSAGIFVFDSLEHAKAFRWTPNGIFSVVRCYGIGPARQFKNIVASNIKWIEMFFYTKSWGKATPKQEVPPGTVCFNAVQLLE